MMVFTIICNYLPNRDFRSPKLLRQVGYRYGQDVMIQEIQDVNNNQQNVTDGKSVLLQAQSHGGTVVSPILSR